MNEWVEHIDGNRYIIHLGAMLRLLLRNIWIILFITILFGGMSYIYSAFFITPLYQSSIKMYVNNTSSTSDATSITSSDITAAQYLVETYAVMLTSKPTIDAVIEQTGVDYTYDQLCSMISTEAINDTEVFRVTVTSSDPAEAAEIANALAEIAPDEIMEIVSGSSVKIVEYATAATEKSSPNCIKYAIIGLVFGFTLGCVGILLISLFRNGMSVEDKIRNEFKDKAVLASIPLMGEKTHGKKQTKKINDTEEGAELCEKMSFSSAEAYKLLRENIAFYFSDVKTCRIIGITSSTRSEGKSTTAINLAYTLALTKKKVCLIDCDFRLPSIAKCLDFRRRPGMTNLMLGHTEGTGVLKKYAAESTCFYVIPAGDIPPNPSELLGSNRMREVLQALSQKFDYLILDLPPVGIVSDALAIAKMIDGMLFVVREDFYDRRVLHESLRTLEGVDTKLLGMVITRSTAQVKEYKRYGSKYGYQYGYGYGQQYAEDGTGSANDPESDEADG